MARGILPALFLVIATIPVLAADVPAFAALKTARLNSGSAELVEITGDRGEPQPQQWTLLFKAPSARGGVLEIVVGGNEIVAVRTPLRGYSGASAQPAVASSRLKFDSDAVFRLVNKQADLRRVGFHWLDYSLRADTVTGAPIWVVNIYDSMGPRVGMMKISAEDGSIITPLQVVEQFRVDENPRRFSDTGPGQTVEGVVGTVGNAAKTTVNRVKDTTLRAVGTVQEVITGERTIGPQEDDQ